jgi:sulfatase modifying factor 1
MLTFTALLLAGAIGSSMVTLPAGTWRPLYGRNGDAPVKVASFRLDRYPVTNGDYLTFARANPQWRASAPEAGSAADLRRPVKGVSWHAARAYCQAQGKRLPTVAEWEYAAAASATKRDAARDASFVQHLVTLYSSRPRVLPAVERAETNAFGVRGMHDLGWEWTDDFPGAPDVHEHHAAAMKEGAHDMYCASAAIGALDPTNYAAFLRFAVRGALAPTSSMGTLGFRCAA